MTRPIALACSLAMLALASAGTAQAPPAQGLSIRAVRFYRADTKQTRITAFVRIPYSLMSAGPTGGISYEVRVKVSDSTGLTLHTDKWRNHATAAAAQQVGAETVDMVEFAVAPGTYRLDVAVADSSSGRQADAAITITGYAADPGASDLVLSPGMRVSSADDTVPRAGELRRGSTLITATAGLRLTPLRTKAYYLLEAYNGTAAELSGSMAVAITDSSGRKLLQTPPTAIKVAPGGGLLRSMVDLEGLPPGRYTFTVKADVGGRSFERSADLTMGELRPTLERDTVRLAAERVGDEGFFAQVDESRLDALEEPLAFIAPESELRAYTKELSAAAKRRFLTDFWKKRDPSPGTAVNELRQSFYERVDYANRAYRERGRGQQPGWKSDRGRIYARYGAPQDSLARQQEGVAPRYTVWRYTSGKGRYFIFTDRTGIGNWVLLTTNDINERTLPNWQEIVGFAAVQDMGRFLGQDLSSSRQRFQ